MVTNYIGKEYNTHRRAFTLIELLVVVAVISVLIAITIPALRAARSHARRIYCRSNLRQIDLCYNLYLDDHDGRLYRKESFMQRDCHFTFGGWNPPQFTGVPRPLNNYVGKRETFKCPSDTHPLDVYMQNGNSYVANILITNMPAMFYPTNIAKRNVIHDLIYDSCENFKRVIERPSDLVWITEDPWWCVWDVMWLEECRNWHQKRHYYNVAFMDSHIEFSRVARGIYISPEYGYRVYPPSGKIDQEIQEMQEREACPCGYE